MELSLVAGLFKVPFDLPIYCIMVTVKGTKIIKNTAKI